MSAGCGGTETQEPSAHRFRVASACHDLLEGRPQVVDGVETPANLSHVLDVAVELVDGGDALAQVLFVGGAAGSVSGRRRLSRSSS